MWPIDINTEHYILLFAVVITLCVAVMSNKRMSTYTFCKYAGEYELVINKCNELIEEINKTIDELRLRYFVAATDEKEALFLVKRYQNIYKELVVCNEKLGFYLKRRDARRYNKCIKQTNALIGQLKEILFSLENVKLYTQSQEERNAARITFENAGTFNNTSYSEDDATNEHYNNSDNDNIQSLASNDVFFAGCDTLAEVEKRYRSLAKVYHPDMPTGNKEMFQKLLDEYERKRVCL